jgi:hypothetical protein
MKTEYKYLRFIDSTPKQKTKVWECTNKDKENPLILGSVFWYGGWRQYCFEPSIYEGALFFNSTCLLDIADFLKQANNGHKTKSQGGCDG